MTMTSDDADLSDVDRDALQRCVALVLADQTYAPIFIDMLQREPWSSVAISAAYNLQIDVLKLTPWEQPPCVDESLTDPQAIAIADRLRAAGLSVFEPDPMAALAKVEPPPPPSPRRAGARRSRPPP